MPGGQSRTGKNATVDRDVLHRLLWSRTDHAGRIRIHQSNLAEDLGVTKFTVSRIMHEFLREDRVTKLGTAKGNIATYVITNPAVWAAGHA